MRWIDRLWERHYQRPPLSRTVEIVLGIKATHNPFTPVFNAFRFYADGTESGSSPLGNQDQNITVDVSSGNQQVHLRVRIDETGGDSSGSGNDDWVLESQKNGSGGFVSIDGSQAGLTMDTGSSLTNNGATTNRATNGISDGPGSFVAGIQKEGDSGQILDYQLTAGNFTEHVFAMLLTAASLNNGDFFDFRVTLNGGTPGMTNNVTPRITIVKSAPSASPKLEPSKIVRSW